MSKRAYSNWAYLKRIASRYHRYHRQRWETFFLEFVKISTKLSITRLVSFSRLFASTHFLQNSIRSSIFHFHLVFPPAPAAAHPFIFHAILSRLLVFFSLALPFCHYRTIILVIVAVGEKLFAQRYNVRFVWVHLHTKLFELLSSECRKHCIWMVVNIVAELRLKILERNIHDRTRTHGRERETDVFVCVYIIPLL